MQAKVLLDVSVVCFRSHILNSTATLVSILSSGGEFPKLIVHGGFWDGASHAWEIFFLFRKGLWLLHSLPRESLEPCSNPFRCAPTVKLFTCKPTGSWPEDLTFSLAHGHNIFSWTYAYVCVFLHVTCRRLISVKRIRMLTKQESIMKQNNNTTKKIRTKQNKWLLSKWIWHQKSSLMLRLLQKAQAPARWGFKQQTKQYSTVFMRAQHDRLYLGFIPKA